MDWRVKGTVQKTLSAVPFGDRIHSWLRRSVGGHRHIEQQCDERIAELHALLGQLLAAGVDLRRATLVEVGTGWYPALPFGLYLAGAARVRTYDIHRHLDLAISRICLLRYAKELPALARATGEELGAVETRYRALLERLEHGLGDATAGGIEYFAPADARATGLPGDSVDVVFSNNVLEHIPEDVIRGIMRETARVLRPDGLAIHNVHCGDHYGLFDRKITQLNYLQYSPAAWRKWDNDFLYQNRLRASDFVRLTEQSGLALAAAVRPATPEEAQALRSVRVDKSFAGYAPADLGVTWFYLVARRSRASADESSPSARACAPFAFRA